MRRRVTLAALLWIATASLFAEDSQTPGDIVRKADVDRTAATNGNQHEVEKYQTDIRDLLDQEKFDHLDEIASSARSTKARFPGGGWKLATVYLALAKPSAGLEATDFEWNTRLERLKRWISRRPSSVTPRIALAQAYLDYAWKARGTDSADKVTNEGWELFGQRAELAQVVLKEASNLKQKCPQWYRVMQTLALAQGWSNVRAATLFEQAIAFEPTYYYYYSAYAGYLLPKWHGDEGDAERFTDEISSRIGGKQGNVIYFEIAASMGCHCSNDVEMLRKMSWPKIEQGHADLEELYGSSTVELNDFAYIAIKMKDAKTADGVFARIGEDWSKETWGTEKYFNECKSWASSVAAYYKYLETALSAAEANMRTPEGRQYDAQIARELPEKYAPMVQQCVKTAGHDLAAFDLFLKIGADGVVHQLVSSPQTAVSHCLLPRLLWEHFDPPPNPPYWEKISMNIKP